MSNKSVAIVLGGTYPHITLLKKLKKKGYYTILIDYYENPPAKVEADAHIQKSTLDKEVVLEIAQETKAELVISTCIDQANVTACYVSEKLRLPRPYSYKIALTVTNKALMKKMMLENNIPTSKYLNISNINEANNINLRYPVIVKPVDSNSSKGVRKAENYSQLKEYLKIALKVSKNNEAIVEEFIEGKEIGLDCIVKDKKTTIILSRERKKINYNNGATQQIYGSFWPAAISKETENKFEKTADKIVSIFNLNNTPLLIQAILNDDGINIIEFAPRIGGGENHKIIELNTGYDIIEAGINSHVNEKINLASGKPEGIYFDNYIYSKPGKFGDVVGFDQIVEDGIAEYSNIYKKKGMIIGEELSSNNRVGVFTVKGDTRKDILDKINKAILKIDINDINGNSIMRKDIYSTLNN